MSTDHEILSRAVASVAPSVRAVLASDAQPRRYLAVKLCAPNDRNGNPRRGWLVYLDTPDLLLLGWVEEGYNGEYLPDYIHAVETGGIIGMDKPGARKFRDSGRVRILCSLSVPYSEIRKARRTPFKLGGA